MVLESSGIAIRSDAIKTKLMQEVKTKGTTGHKKKSAFYSKNANDKKRKQIKCFVCDCMGHFTSQCTDKPTKDERPKKAPNDKQKEQKERTFAAFKISSQEVTNGTWYVDSCASTHITIVNNKLQHGQAYKRAGIVAVNHQAMTAEAVGEVKLHVQTRNGTEEIIAKNVLYVPEGAANLLSVSKLVQKGLSVNFTPKGHTIVDAKRRCLGVMIEENEIFRLETSTEKTYIAAKEPSAKI